MTDSAAAWASSAGSASEIAATASLVSSAASAYSQYQAGRAQQSMYEAEAGQATLRSRGEAVKYEQQGNEILKRLMRTQGLARARAAAGGVDPFSGSAAFVQELSARDAGEEMDLSRENARLSALAGEQQAKQYREAGRQARTRGLLEGIGTFTKGYAGYSKIGRAPAAGWSLPGQFDSVNRQYG